MCGLVALFSRSEPLDPELVHRGLRAIVHRGPDGQKVWSSPDRRALLGHARLSIIDLSTGDQPLSNEDGSIWCIVNGELYDFEAIRVELEGRGHTLKTRSDSEILLHLYEEQGVDALRRLRGEFAFVLWDGRNRTIFAGRDRFGIKPLFFGVKGERLYLASEAKAMFAAGLPAAWDRESLYDSLHTQYLRPDQTLFADVKQIPPGHFMVASLASLPYVRLMPYWSLDYTPEAEKPKVEEAACVEHVRGLLEDAVRTRLRSDVPVAAYLSGGLDSSVVVGVAARHASGPLPCYTIAFETDLHNELEFAQEVAAFAGTTTTAVEVKEEALLGRFGDAVWHSEMLAVNLHGAAKLILSEKVHADGIKVVLGGEGSDEIFAGYPHFIQDMLAVSTDGDAERHRSALFANNPVSAGLLLPSGEGVPLDDMRSRLGYVPGLFQTKATLAHKNRSVLRPAFLEEFGARRPYGEMLNLLAVSQQMRGRHVLDQSLYMWNSVALPNYILSILGDRMEMANSVEGRLPLLDHQLAEYVHRLPVDLKIKQQTEKYVLREVAKPYVPRSIYTRQKHPFMAPPLSARSIEQVQDTLRSRVLADTGIYDPTSTSALLDRLPGMTLPEQIAAAPVLVMALSVCAITNRLLSPAG